MLIGIPLVDVVRHLPACSCPVGFLFLIEIFRFSDMLTAIMENPMAKKNSAKKRAVKKTGAKKGAKKKRGSGKRELINTGRDKRFVRRDNEGQFKESDDVGHSLSQDRKGTAKKKVKSGYGDRGDR
jgi:hypothetical protein